MLPSPENPANVQSVPLAMLFTEGNSPWTEYELPKAALVKEIEDDERSEDESAPSKASAGVG